MKSKTGKVLLGAATLAAMAVGMPKDANAANADINITAQIIKALAIVATETLKFGKITVDATSAGTVTVDDNTDTRAAGGGVSLIGGTAANRGGFSLQGVAGVKVNITAPAAGNVKITDGTGELVVDQFKMSGAAGFLSTAAFTIADLGGTAVVTDNRFGARLSVPGNSSTGTYTGTVTITAAYE